MNSISVVRVEWTNPHIYTVIAVEDEGGSLVEYRAEGAAPDGLLRDGWCTGAVQPGDVVHSRRRLNESHNGVGWGIG